MSSLPMCSDPARQPRATAPKAVALLSGGLDSALAIYLIKLQGIEVVAVHFPSFFSPLDTSREDSPVHVLAQQLEVPVLFLPKGRDFLDVIRHPRYGYGKNLNPCIDCRIYTFQKTREILEEHGASFIVTGEVAGQRPMSQRRDTMRLIDKRSGCDGIVVRPLSAKVLPITVPEQTGVVNRDLLLDVAGRGRKVQMKLAQEIGLHGYSPPAGGCLLTDKGFSQRLRDLLDNVEDPSEEDLDLLHFGRHLRLRTGLKLVVARNEAENHRIEELGKSGIIFFPAGFPGPSVVVQGVPGPDEEMLIGSVLLRYVKPAARGDRIRIREAGQADRSLKVPSVAMDEWIDAHRI